MRKYVLEACVDSAESAVNAEKGGANRYELCGNLIIGGTTPSLALYNAVRKYTKVETNILIRPRFGDFLYSDYEFEIIKNEVAMFRDAKADGVVIGCLTPDGTLDMEQMKILVDTAGDMNVTLHRAFDVSRDPFETLEQVKQLGIKTILTSGQKNNCYAGKDLLKQLIKEADGKVDILIGGGVNADIIGKMMDEMDARCFHLSGKVTLNSNMNYRKEGVNMGLPSLSEFEIWQTDENNIAKAKAVFEAKLAEKGLL